ncbi:MAG: RES family NAD+ phosphorylase [bacterium]|nr:RES family NAD+ phosphorylase [bacterium]
MIINVDSKTICKIIEKSYYKNAVPKLWIEFVEALKHKNRFFPGEKFIPLLNKLEMFKDDLKKRSSFHRARIMGIEYLEDIDILEDTENESEVAQEKVLRGFPASEMNAPPFSIALSGRANPSGISYLYLASTPETACAEVRPEIGDLISVAEFKILRNLQIINLCKLADEKKHYISIEDECFFEVLQQAFSRPCRPHNDAEYLATQFVSSYLASKGYAGIKYFSAQDSKNKEYNLVLFNRDDAKCMDEYGKVYRCTEKTSLFENLSSLYS